MAGVKLTHIPYKGTSPALADVLAGHVGIMFGETGSVLPHIRVGSLRALAVTSAHRDPSLPDVPTVGETLPGFEASPWNGVVAPPRTPAPIAEKIAMAIADAMKEPDVEKRLTQRNFQIVGGGPVELQRLLKDENARWSVVIRNLKAQGGLAAAN
jgi:tripartite-type tricarboxylate transporter receptor subunit TctC